MGATITISPTTAYFLGSHFVHLIFWRIFLGNEQIV